MKKKVLVIPGPFVPYNDTLTLLNYKRLSHLDCDFDVLALGGEEDNSLADELINDVNYDKFSIIRILDYKKMDIVHNPLCIFYFIYSFIKYEKESLRLLKKNNYDIVYTSSHPGMTHLIGKKIKKKYKNTKWIASFSDPIKGSPYKNDPEILKRSIFYRMAFNIGTFFYIGDYYEKAAMEFADKLVFICEEQKEFTCAQYDNANDYKKKSVIVPLSIEPTWKMYKNLLITNTTAKSNKPLIASHLGRVYGLRKIDSFLLALKELKNEGIISNKNIIFNQYGEVDVRTSALINKYNLSDIFIVNNKISYSESIEIMKKSDILILFDTLMKNARIQPYLPSKIIEYLVLKKPILGICDANSPSYRILDKYGFLTIGSDKDIIKNNIISLISQRNIKDYDIEEFYSNNVISELRKIIEQ